MNFQKFCNVPLNPLPNHGLIELKIMMAILFEIFSIELLLSNTKIVQNNAINKNLINTFRKVNNWVIIFGQILIIKGNFRYSQLDCCILLLKIVQNS